ncbi:MAG TPA: zinc ribbon domain-containing protein [Candidatus Acidoferrum sp.]|nr:zinc ribbon domain-containing protein [Candidatus Acidoferrum sp.]
MPIYEYRCEACGAELEKLQKISEPPLRECPECGRETLVKLVSASSFRLKGGGWYESDFKTGKKKNGLAASESGNASDANVGKRDGKSDAGSETKPASGDKPAAKDSGGTAAAAN